MNLTMLAGMVAATWCLDRARRSFFDEAGRRRHFCPMPAGVGSAFVIAAIGRPKRTVSPLPHLVRARCLGMAQRIVFPFTILDTAIIGEYLIAK
jgi:hypothetical protein